MKRLFVMLAVLVAAGVVHGEAVKEVGKWLRVAEDVQAIAFDARDLYRDLASDKGVLQAAGSVADAWGDLRAAAAHLRHGKVADGLAELESAAGDLHNAYLAITDDSVLVEAKADAGRLLQAVQDLVNELRSAGVETVLVSCDQACRTLEDGGCTGSVAACVEWCNDTGIPSCTDGEGELVPPDWQDRVQVLDDDATGVAEAMSVASGCLLTEPRTGPSDCYNEDPVGHAVNKCLQWRDLATELYKLRLVA